MMSIGKLVKATTRLIVCTLIGLVLMSGLSSRASAEPMREFIVSCSYGVLAGTLVGAATLAFSDKPGDNLNKVARGASLGLYAGILLGLYVVYGVPNQQESEIRDQLGFRSEPPPSRLLVAPVVSANGALEGGEIRYDVLRF